MYAPASFGMRGFLLEQDATAPTESCRRARSGRRVEIGSRELVELADGCGVGVDRRALAVEGCRMYLCIHQYTIFCKAHLEYEKVPPSPPRVPNCRNPQKFPREYAISRPK